MSARVFVAQPIYRDVPGPAAMSFAQLLVGGTMLRQIVNVGQCYAGVLSQARNRLVLDSRASIPSHVLFTDADMITPPDMLAKLIAADVDVVSALYFRRDPPYQPAAVAFDGQPLRDYGEGLDVVGGIGMGCALIRSSVFSRIEEHFGDQRWFSFESGPGEDVFFCERCRALNIPVYQHSGVKCGHVGHSIITEEDFLKAKQP
jgi:hypothetical protein